MSRALALSRFYLRHLTQPLASLSHPSPPSPFSIFSASPYATSKYPNSGGGGGDDDQQSVVSLFNRDPSAPPRLFVVQPRLRPASFLQAKLNEALCLANSLEEQRDGYFDTDFFEKELPPHVVVQNPSLRSKPRADTFFGPGTVTDIKCHLTAAESKAEEVDAVFVNTILSGIQQRNLERILDKPVLDRVGLIIEIFNAHAHTKEAKLQAELAALMYKKSRLVRVRGPDGRYTFGASAEAEVVSARGRGSGGRGFISGAGETELQLQRRRILDRRRHLLSQIEEVRRTRAVQRAARKRHGGLCGEHLATVAVVGYTNAGKSTLISAVSNNDLYSDARLFATLDARLRAVFLPSGRKVLLSDTVGFISDLPVQLVEAFHSTLEEVVEADLLVHVIDCTAPNLDEHRSTVLGVLKQIGVSEEKLRNMIEVWNKIDYHEEMGADNFVDDWDGAEIPGEEEGGGGGGGEEGEEEREDRTTNSDGLEENDVESEPQLSQGTPENPEELADDSDAWLHSGDESDSLYEEWNSLNNRTTGSSESTAEKASHGEATDGPHVKVSAITGVGLQELLKLIDDKLERAVAQKKMSEALIQSNSIFDRKWRPPRSRDKENEIAVEN